MWQVVDGAQRVPATSSCEWWRDNRTTSLPGARSRCVRSSQGASRRSRTRCSSASDTPCDHSIKDGELIRPGRGERRLLPRNARGDPLRELQAGAASCQANVFGSLIRPFLQHFNAGTRRSPGVLRACGPTAHRLARKPHYFRLGGAGLQLQGRPDATRVQSTYKRMPVV